MPIITQSLINTGKSKTGHLSAGQIRLLTGTWLKTPGWEKQVIGKFIDQRVADLFRRKFIPPRRVKPPRYGPSDRRDRILRETGARSTRGLMG